MRWKPTNLFFGVGVVGDIDELSHIWRVDLLILRSDEHAGGADQLKLGSLDRHVTEEPADIKINLKTR